MSNSPDEKKAGRKAAPRSLLDTPKNAPAQRSSKTSASPPTANAKAEVPSGGRGNARPTKAAAPAGDWGPGNPNGPAGRSPTKHWTKERAAARVSKAHGRVNASSGQPQTILDKLRVKVAPVAKPTQTASTIGDAIEASRVGHATNPTTTGKLASPAHSVGFLGETGSWHALQQKGEVVLFDKHDPGSSSKGFKSAFSGLNQGGFDSVSIGLKNGKLTLFVNDNKSYSKTGAIQQASALHENRKQNVKSTIKALDSVAKNKAYPYEVRLLHRLGAKLAKAGRIQARLTNVGGNSTGSKVPGAVFVDLNPGTGKQQWKFDRSEPTDKTPKGGFLTDLRKGKGTGAAGQKSPSPASTVARSAMKTATGAKPTGPTGAKPTGATAAGAPQRIGPSPFKPGGRGP
jgi:hypothetical protein